MEQIEIKSINNYRDTSPIRVSLKGVILKVDYRRTREVLGDVVEIDISGIMENRKYDTGQKVSGYFLCNRLLFVHELRNHNTLVVFTEGERVKYYIHSDERTHPLAQLVVVKSRAYLRLTRRGIRVVYSCFIINKYRNLPIKSTYLTIGEDFKKQKQFPVYRKFPSLLTILTDTLFSDYIKLSPLLEGEPAINEKIGVSLNIDNTVLATHFLTKGSKRLAAKGKKWFYAPIARTRRNGYSVSIRRNGSGGLSLVRRRLEEVEKTLSFRFYESTPVSFLLYHAAHTARWLSKKTVNIYFEKNANQAEEGTISLFRRARDNGKSKNFFIINKWSKDYSDIATEKGVVPNFTLKSYWLLYRANNFIATETAGHANVLRSDNKYIRSAPYSQKFIFLQHGITYMKAHEKNTSFTRHREAEPDYMIVDSKKERDIVSSMLNIEEERLLNTGMLIFDTINYNHINQKSPNIVTVMLTWKPYEEHLKDATKSTYYKTVVSLYRILEPLVGKDNLRIVIHPKFKDHMEKTDMAEAIWQGTIAEVLAESKLLITDYSSVCYNVFYQGGAVVYYQPDIELYERVNGKLIPGEDEYTGYRIFAEDEIKRLLEDNIVDGKILLSKLRTKKHIQNYLSINEHNDGRNIDRIYDGLQRLDII